MGKADYSFFWILVVISLQLFFSDQGNGQTYTTKMYYEADGLASNEVYDVTQDKDGAMWFLTKRGISTFNGRYWKTYKSDLKLPDWITSEIKVTDDSSIWAGGFNDDRFVIKYYNNKKWKSIDLPKTLTDKSPRVTFDVYNDSRHFFLAYNDQDSLYYLSGKKWQKLLLSDQYGKRIPVNRVVFDLAGRLYVLSSKGLYFFNGKNFDVFSLKTDPGVKMNLREITFDSNNNLQYFLGDNWFGELSANGRLRMIQKGLKFYSRPYGEYAYLLNSHYGIFFGINSAPFLFDKSSGVIKKICFDQKKLSAINDIFEDREGNIWVASYRGVGKLSSLKFENYIDGFSPFTEVASILEIDSGKVFIGENKGFKVLQDKKVVFDYQYPQVPENSPFRVLDVCKTGRGNLLFSTGDKAGLGILDKANNVSFIKSPEGGMVSAVGIINDTVYVAGEKTKLYRLDKGQLEFVAEAKHYIRKIVQASNGRAYVLTHGKLVDFPSMRDDYEVPSKKMASIYALLAYEGKILVGTGGGLAIINGRKLDYYQLEEVKIDRPVYALLKDSQNNLWIGTDAGIYLYNEEEGLKHYNRSNGLSGDEVNRRALVEDSDGNVWIGTENGFSICYKSVYEKQVVPPNTIINVNLGAGEVAENNNDWFKLEHNENNLEFTVYAISFNDYQPLNHRVILEGFDKGWRDIDASFHKMLFPNLSPGKYRFLAQSRNGGGPWGEITSSALIHIKKPFYESWWFLIMSFTIVGSIFYIIIYIFLQKRNQRILNAKIDQALTEIEQSKQELKEKNETLSRINRELDSFVYSASHDLRAPLASILGLLNIIKIYGQENLDNHLKLIEKSVNKLDEFIKSIIDYSRNDRSTISKNPIDFEELVASTLENFEYMDGSGEIKKNVYIHQDSTFYSDLNRVQVVLNNLVSNSIKYKRRGVDSYLDIHVEANEDYARIRVKDNGVGIEQSRIDKVFDMFYQASEEAFGSGLGLYITKETVSKLKGKISLKSTLGQQTEFDIVIPNLYREQEVAKLSSV